jgi:superfamily I DNA/RNA helicase
LSDESVRNALRSDAPLVVIEAPAGCGKTHQGAEYVGDLIQVHSGRILILTHTHAACSVFAERIGGAGSKAEIRTIDSLIDEIATAYHVGLGIPPETGAWVRQQDDGHAELATKVARLLKRYPMIAWSLVNRYPDPVFRDIKLDCHKEFWDAVRLGDFETPELGLADLAHRRAYSRPRPPDRAISTIHKAKGLECDSVIIAPCDNKTFPDKPDSRCLLYVALSRAKKDLMLIVSRDNPSPLLII